MSATDLLQRLEARGVSLSSDGDRLSVDAPAGVLRDEDWEEIALGKLLLLELLSGPSKADAAERLIADLRERGYLISLGEDDRVKVNTPNGGAIPVEVIAEMKPLRTEIEEALRLEVRMTLYPTEPGEILAMFDRLGIVLLWREGGTGLSAFAPVDAIPTVELRELIKRIRSITR